ncbi:hypothetical protein J2X69_002479 [Algoriphagus sp. 4150]|uniref:hypothetical protein n=1 Tax=Algoriphagus sp. 4150 TaxID=2817756 RepID=UPI0028548BA6|nr:hypothetical protein [Algoriphagus sp. 4150]MDR7130131.1 hypothetical protein [Algoriphagus sp. 4150]
MRSRKIVFALMLCLVSFLANAQYKGQWRAIHAYEWSGSDYLFGMNFTAEYFPAHYLSIAPSYTIFLPATGKASSLDIHARYYLTEKKNQFYGLAGVQHYFYNKEFDNRGKQVVRSLSLGAGGMLKLNESLGFNPEIKYSFSPANRLVLKAGVVYFIN